MEVSYDAFIRRLLFLCCIILLCWLYNEENRTHYQQSATTWCFIERIWVRRKTFLWDSLHKIICRSISLSPALEILSLLFHTAEEIILVIIRCLEQLVLREQTDKIEKVCYAWHSRVATWVFSSKWQKAASAVTVPSSGMMFEKDLMAMIRKWKNREVLLLLLTYDDLHIAILFCSSVSLVDPTRR